MYNNTSQLQQAVSSQLKKRLEERQRCNRQVKALGPDVKSWVCRAAASGESKTATRDAAVRTSPLQTVRV